MKYLLEKYTKVSKEAERKRKMFEISLGALSYLFKEYKELQIIKSESESEENKSKNELNDDR